MPRRVFFSFHYQRDVWRINQIRNLPEITGSAAAGFHDASLWEDAKRKGDANVQRMIDNALQNTSVTVVFIGAQTAGRKFINYEINKSVARGNGLLGVRINHLRDRNGQIDAPGAVPSNLVTQGAAVYSYTNAADLTYWIERAASAAGR